MHDNAATYFEEILNTYEYGREFSIGTLETDPRIGWLVDPFGLSLTTSRLYADMNYEEFVMVRIPETDQASM